MQPGQDPMETDTFASLRRRQFIEYLQQQQLLFQQMQRQTSNLLPLLSLSNPTETTIPNWNPLNLCSDLAASAFVSSSPTSISPVQTGSLPDDWSNPRQSQYNQEYFQFEQEEEELIDDDNHGASGRSLKPHLDDMPMTSDFVKKLYRMLEEPKFQQVVCWGPQGDCFVVKDMQECTQFVLPRLFKHSNFSSFVRQLNKYGFHKIKQPEGSQSGQQSWIFQHPYFRADQPEALEKIKRKPSPPRKNASQSTPTTPTVGPSSSSSLSTYSVNRPALRRRLSAPQRQSMPTEQPIAGISQDLVERITTLEHNQQGLFGKMINFHQDMAARNELIQNLIAHFQNPSDGFHDASPTNSITSPFPAPNVRREPEQGSVSMIQQSESPLSTFRLIQPSFDPGN